MADLALNKSLLFTAEVVSSGLWPRWVACGIKGDNIVTAQAGVDYTGNNQLVYKDNNGSEFVIAEPDLGPYSTWGNAVWRWQTPSGDLAFAYTISNSPNITHIGYDIITWEPSLTVSHTVIELDTGLSLANTATGSDRPGGVQQFSGYMRNAIQMSNGSVAFNWIGGKAYPNYEHLRFCVILESDLTTVHQFTENINHLAENEGASWYYDIEMGSQYGTDSQSIALRNASDNKWANGLFRVDPSNNTLLPSTRSDYYLTGYGANNEAQNPNTANNWNGGKNFIYRNNGGAPAGGGRVEISASDSTWGNDGTITDWSEPIIHHQALGNQRNEAWCPGAMLANPSYYPGKPPAALVFLLNDAVGGNYGATLLSWPDGNGSPIPDMSAVTYALLADRGGVSVDWDGDKGVLIASCQLENDVDGYIVTCAWYISIDSPSAAVTALKLGQRDDGLGIVGGPGRINYKSLNNQKQRIKFGGAW